MNNDVISRQAAIDAILDDKIGEESLAIMKALGSENEAKTLNMACDRHTEFIKKIPSAQRWIPVSEGLPKNDDWVIVTILDESGDTPFRYSDFGWYLEEANCWIVDAQQRSDVVAWEPLPKPYKEADDGEVH